MMSDQAEPPWVTWPLWRKTRLTPARQINDPGDLPDVDGLYASDRGFYVVTREGRLFSPWGSFLAVDSGGNLYPIAQDEFAAIYELDDPNSDLFPPDPGSLSAALDDERRDAE